MINTLMEQSRLLKTLCNKMKHLTIVSKDVACIYSSKPLYVVDGLDECCICYTRSRLSKLGCGHEFCLSCIRILKVQETPRCALCRAPIVGVRHKVTGYQG